MKEAASGSSPLGRRVSYQKDYAPFVLVGVPREEGRRALGLTGDLPFSGVDLWNAYELSWLDKKGKPVVATAELWIPAESPRMVESKSLKLYLNSLNGMRFDSVDAVHAVISEDLQRLVGAKLELRLSLSPDQAHLVAGPSEGTCIDDTDIVIDTYNLDPELLNGSAEAGTEVEETLYSHLMKSNCPVTGQPDWATVIIRYRGGKIDRAALLRYIASYRNHREFHEQCVERIFSDIQGKCDPRKLTVLARYTRRGGIDINPFRSNFEDSRGNARLWRQ